MYSIVSAKWSGVSSLDLLVLLSLVQPRMQLAFIARGRTSESQVTSCTTRLQCFPLGAATQQSAPDCSKVPFTPLYSSLLNLMKSLLIQPSILSRSFQMTTLSFSVPTAPHSVASSTSWPSVHPIPLPRSFMKMLNQHQLHQWPQKSIACQRSPAALPMFHDDVFHVFTQSPCTRIKAEQPTSHISRATSPVNAQDMITSRHKKVRPWLILQNSYKMNHLKVGLFSLYCLLQGTL